MSAEATDGEKKKSNKTLLIVIIAAVVVVLAAAAVVAALLLSGGDEAPKEDPTTAYGAVVALEDEMTLNLSDGAYLKTKLSLQLSEAGTENAGGAEALATFDGSKARDAAILILSRHTKEQLLQPQTREAAQQELSKEVSERYGGDVLRVYFTEFVMQ